MTALQATQRWSGKGGGTQARDNVFMDQNATLIYDVQTTSATDDESDVLLAPGLPLDRQAHPTRPFLRVFSRQARKIGVVSWEVSIEYQQIQGAQGNNSPLDAPPQIEWTTTTTEEEIDEDINSKPICTVNGEPFDPPIRVPKSDLVLRVTKNLANFDPSLIRFYTNTVNSNPIFGQPPGTAKINYLGAVTVSDNDFTYVRASIEIQFRRGAPRTTDEKAWYSRIRAQGFFVNQPLPAGIALPANIGKPNIVRARDANGQLVTKPVLHFIEDTTFKGTAYKKGQKIPTDVDDPWPIAYWYEFQVFESKDFSPLGFF